MFEVEGISLRALGVYKMSIKHKRRTVIVNCGVKEREREREMRKRKGESDASNESRGEKRREEEERDPGKNERAVFHTHDSLR